MRSRKIVLITIILVIVMSVMNVVNAASKIKIGNRLILYGILGDVNGDKKITSKDRDLVMEHSVGSKRLFLFQRKRADVNQDGKITSSDALEITEYINSSGNSNQNVSSITISGARTMNQGQTITLTAIVQPTNATNKRVEWSSSSTTKATIDENGKLTAKEAGIVTITAKVGDKKATHTIEIKGKAVTKVEINQMPNKTEYKVDEMVNTSGLKLKVTYSDGTTEIVTKGFEYTPQKLDASGEKQVIVTYFGKQVKYNVTVGALKTYGANSIKTKTSMPKTMEKPKGKYANLKGWMLKFINNPNNETVNMNKNRKYTSTGAVVLYYANMILGADIDQKMITSTYQKDSTGTNWAKGNYTGKEYNSFKEQLNAIYAELVKGNPAGIPVKDKDGISIYLLVYAIPKTTTSTTQLKAEDFKTIDPRTGGYTDLGQYYQYKQNGKPVYRVAFLNENAVNKIQLNTTSVQLNANKTKQLTATPLNSGNVTVKIPKLTKITWSTSDSSVATVNADGLVTAKNGGTAKITAKSGNNKTAVCTVTVKNDETFLQTAEKCHEYLRKNKYSYGHGATIPLNANRSKYVDCSSYVSWVLYEYGYKDFGGAQRVCSDFINNKNSYTNKYNWKYKPAKDAIAGDIIVRSNHMEIYAGNGRYLNAGSTVAIRRALTGGKWGTGYLSGFTYAITIPKK